MMFHSQPDAAKPQQYSHRLQSNEQLACLACTLLVLASLSSVASLQGQCSSLAHDEQNEFCSGRAEVDLSQDIARASVVESIFGQLIKTVVYGGAAFAQLNSRLLCPILKRESLRNNKQQPQLFLFKNSERPDYAYKIYSNDDITADMFAESQFDRNEATIILIHGWLGGIQNEFWLNEAKNVALQTTKFLPDDDEAYRPNVIIVDWSEFAQGSLYTATQNSYKVARRLGQMLAALSRVGRMKPELMHCLGHSIGAHICGQAVRFAFPPQPIRGYPVESGTTGNSNNRRRRFGRITALDPGGFCYEINVRNETKYLGLRPSDALLVDAYYTNRSPFGNRYQVAQYNVRVNRGIFQKQCSVWRNSTVSTKYFRSTVKFVLGSTGHNEILTCDHYFATRFAHQLLKKPPALVRSNSGSPQCSYVAYACDSYRNFIRGRCGQCDNSDQCYSMDFEFQRARPSIRNHISHVYRHSYLLNNKQGTDSGRFDSLPGAVPYMQRGVFYTKIADDEPYCSHMYRVRLELNGGEISGVRRFRTEWLELQLLGIVTLLDSSSNKYTGGTLNLHGPWDQANDSADMATDKFGLTNRTLTAMFELKRPERIKGILVIFDERVTRHINPYSDFIESVHFDYLSTTDPEIRSFYSSSYYGDDIEIQLRRS